MNICANTLEIIKNNGYLFVNDFFTERTLELFQYEINSLPLEAGDHVNYPINKGQTNEVKQFHHRYYCNTGEDQVPVATNICNRLSDLVKPFKSSFRDSTGRPISNWLMSEVGYQRYYAPNDWISPHKDRKSDLFLSVTITISGSAWINIYDSEVDPPDYKKLIKIDSHLTLPGTVLFLRAPGFGSGKQVIHEVMPPITKTRDIVNLRMRPTILKDPNNTKWK